MGIFSRSVDSPNTRKAKQLIRESEAVVERMMKPLGEVSLAIVKASHTCSQALKPMLNVADAKEKQWVEIYVFYEFLYFFMHLVMRSAFLQLTEQQIESMQNYLGSVVSSTAVDSFFTHWPENLKENMKTDFYVKLNDAEVEYSKYKELHSKESPLTSNSLFSKLARNVAELSGNPMNLETLVFVRNSAVDAYASMNLDSLVGEAGKVL